MDHPNGEQVAIWVSESGCSHYTDWSLFRFTCVIG